MTKRNLTLDNKLRALPRTLSGMIRVAVADLTRAENSPTHKVSMGWWLAAAYRNDDRPKKDEIVCAVCLAGSVMAFELGRDLRHRDDPFKGIGQPYADRLIALDDVHRGNISEAFTRFYGWPLGFAPYNVKEVSELDTFGMNYGTTVQQHERFQRQLLRIADKLDALGY